MKIGIVCYPTFGGSGVVATELGKALAKKEHQVHFITYTQPVRLDNYHKNIYYHEVRTPDYPLFKYLPYESALTSTLVDVTQYYELDLLHVHYAIPHASAAYLAQQILKEDDYHLPFITTLHGTDITLVGSNNNYAPVVRFSINQSDGVTTVSESLKADTMEHFDIKKPIKVIPNFVDLEQFRQQSPKDHFRKAIATEEEKILIHVSNFRKVKRVSDVVHIFRKVREEVPCKLLLVGDGPERNNVEKLCREWGNCHDIRFLGKQEPVADLLSISDLFLLPSAHESFGLAALEAMGCGVPVISTDVGGLPEINIHNKTGMLSKVGDTDDMAKNAISLLTHPSKLKKFKKQALQQARQYDISQIMPQYESFYKQIIDQVQSSTLSSS